jgi:hypothetical protein
MPKDVLDELQEGRAKDQQEFEDAFNDVLGDTEEKVDETLKKEVEAEASAGAGDAQGEQKNEGSDSSYAFDRQAAEPVDPKPVDPVPDTSGDSANWQSKAEELEAELAKEKQRTASWDGRIKAANEKSKKLEEQVAILLKERNEKVEAKTAKQDLDDKEKMELFKENFPELADFADILERRMAGFRAPAPAKVEPEPEATEVTPAPAKADTNEPPEPSKHYLAITKVHPELDEIVNSGKLLSWINQQADYIRPHLSRVYNSGTADEVISVVTEFKNKTGFTSAVAENNPKQDKLNSMLEADGESPGPKSEGPDKNDFAGTAKSIGL